MASLWERAGPRASKTMIMGPARTAFSSILLATYFVHIASASALRQNPKAATEPLALHSESDWNDMLPALERKDIDSIFSVGDLHTSKDKAAEFAPFRRYQKSRLLRTILDRLEENGGQTADAFESRDRAVTPNEPSVIPRASLESFSESLKRFRNFRKVLRQLKKHLRKTALDNDVEQYIAILRTFGNHAEQNGYDHTDDGGGPSSLVDVKYVNEMQNERQYPENRQHSTATPRRKCRKAKNRPKRQASPETMGKIIQKSYEGTFGSFVQPKNNRWNSLPANYQQWGPAPADSGQWGNAPVVSGQWNPTPADSGQWGNAPTDSGQWNPAPAEFEQWNPAPAEFEQWNPAPAEFEQLVAGTVSGQWSSSSSLHAGSLLSNPDKHEDLLSGSLSSSDNGNFGHVVQVENPEAGGGNGHGWVDPDSQGIWGNDPVPNDKLGAVMLDDPDDFHFGENFPPSDAIPEVNAENPDAHGIYANQEQEDGDDDDDEYEDC